MRRSSRSRRPVEEAEIVVCECGFVEIKSANAAGIASVTCRAEGGVVGSVDVKGHGHVHIHSYVHVKVHIHIHVHVHIHTQTKVGLRLDGPGRVGCAKWVKG